MDRNVTKISETENSKKKPKKESLNFPTYKKNVDKKKYSNQTKIHELTPREIVPYAQNLRNKNFLSSNKILLPFEKKSNSENIE